MCDLEQNHFSFSFIGGFERVQDLTAFNLSSIFQVWTLFEVQTNYRSVIVNRRGKRKWNYFVSIPRLIFFMITELMVYNAKLVWLFKKILSRLVNRFWDVMTNHFQASFSCHHYQSISTSNKCTGCLWDKRLDGSQNVLTQRRSNEVTFKAINLHYNVWCKS